MDTDLIDCRWIWREGMALGAILALLIRFVAVESYKLWKEERKCRT